MKILSNLIKFLSVLINFNHILVPEMRIFLLGLQIVNCLVTKFTSSNEVIAWLSDVLIQISLSLVISSETSRISLTDSITRR